VKRHELGALAHFSERYAIPTGDVNERIEQAVLGAAWGANGYTTVAQADELGRRLQLGPQSLLLDFGSGRGWPGLYLASQTGCSVVCSDMPLVALGVAARRAKREAIEDRVSIVAASAAEQPFAPETFDAVVHTDVLC
jgi:methylase of polypeptide subunit release factors